MYNKIESNNFFFFFLVLVLSFLIVGDMMRTLKFVAKDFVCIDVIRGGAPKADCFLFIERAKKTRVPMIYWSALSHGNV